MSISCQIWRLLFSDQFNDTGHLEQLAVGRSQGDEGHLARVGVDLLHQQGQLGSSVFPVLDLNLDQI